jgi:hypothetical protein
MSGRNGRPGPDSGAAPPTRTPLRSIPRAGDVIRLPERLGCPLVRAAYRLHDPDVLTVVERVHPPEFCPAARRQVPQQRSPRPLTGR